VLRKRERELGYLDTRYASGRAELAVLYGRRRVGKTTLAYHWAQDKPHLFFFATQDDNATLLRRFSQLIKSAAGEDATPAFSYPDWDTALRSLAPAPLFPSAGAAACRRGRVVVEPWGAD
jgi:AAA+ ATPase superfamily predicted ATPase